MRDAIEFEKKGLPCAVIVHDRFAVAAHSQARALGVPGLRIVPLAQPRPGRIDPSEEAAKAEEMTRRVIDALIQPVPEHA
ncbi:MAG: hypothetical protein HYX92_21050 [Chloroflexi bacterium]|nr:hypothetical protein [Chloroflexota bacterium]